MANNTCCIGTCWGPNENMWETPNIILILSTELLLRVLIGREAQEGGDICIHIADSLCCTAETNTTL